MNEHDDYDDYDDYDYDYYDYYYYYFFSILTFSFRSFARSLARLFVRSLIPRHSRMT